mgnify:CR=1 FL=1
MVFITASEIFAILFMIFGIGFIFSGYFRREPAEGYDPLKYYQRPSMWQDIKFAALIAAPAVVLHELSHKIVAMSFGAQAVLQAPYTMYLIVMLLKLMNFPLLFFVGGYVSDTPLPALASSLVAIAGPLTNFLIWFLIWISIRYSFAPKKYYNILEPMAKINLFLGVFNMIPIPGFDGYHFFASLIRAFTG